MADFNEALANSLRFEDAKMSGIVTYDTGLTTRFGISERAHPEVFPEMKVCSRARALAIASEIFKRDYWRFSNVQSQPVANKLMDMAINIGLSTAIYLCQKAVGTSPDGEWGPRTEFAVNESIDLLPVLREASAEYYRDLAQRNPERYGKFLNGWLHRAAQ